MKKLLWLGALAVVFSGCGELSYKRGGSADDLEAAKKACRAAGNEQAVERCLAEQGWGVKKLDDIDLFAVASVSPDNRDLASRPAATAPLAAPATGGGCCAKSGPATDDGQRTSSAGASGTTSPPSPPASPLDVYTVSSWWKVGAGREALESDTADCVSRLGAAHQPNHQTQQVTRGLVICMHEKGWKALRAQ
jgi:hypothetical protein